MTSQANNKIITHNLVIVKSELNNLKRKYAELEASLSTAEAQLSEAEEKLKSEEPLVATVNVIKEAETPSTINTLKDLKVNIQLSAAPEGDLVWKSSESNKVSATLTAIEPNGQTHTAESVQFNLTFKSQEPIIDLATKSELATFGTAVPITIGFVAPTTTSQCGQAYVRQLKYPGESGAVILEQCWTLLDGSAIPSNIGTLAHDVECELEIGSASSTGATHSVEITINAEFDLALAVGTNN